MAAMEAILSEARTCKLATMEDTVDVEGHYTLPMSSKSSVVER